MAKTGRRTHFTDRKISKRSIASLIISFLSVLWMIIGINIAVKNGDNSGNALGAFGMLLMVAEIVAFVMSMQSIHDDEVFRGLPMASLLVAGVILAGWIFIFCYGIHLWV